MINAVWDMKPARHCEAVRPKQTHDDRQGLLRPIGLAMTPHLDSYDARSILLMPAAVVPVEINNRTDNLLPRKTRVI